MCTLMHKHAPVPLATPLIMQIVKWKMTCSDKYWRLHNVESISSNLYLQTLGLKNTFLNV